MLLAALSRHAFRPPLLALAIAVAWAGPAFALASFDEVRRDFRPSDTAVLDRDGALLQRVRTDATVRRGQWIALADVSPALRTAMVLSEDRRFYEHSGVDWRAVSSAAWGNLWNTRTRGASTITMQLAGLIEEDLRRRTGGRSVSEKIGQAITATQLERNWRKDQVLEAYLNTVPFRGEIVGIDALSRTLFGKAPHGLDAREAAVAAALVRAPNAKPALVAQRACEVMKAMEATEAERRRIDCDAVDMFASAALQRRAFDPSEGIAPHAARRALQLRRDAARAPGANTADTTLRTTLRAPLQRFAVNTLQRHLRELRGRNVEDAALVVLDNASGEVLAWVGSSGALSRAGEVDAVLAQRQPGSTLKPLLYAQAIAERRLTAASLLDDSSAQIATAGGLYIPQNYDRQFKGPVSVRTALAASLNVPAVRTLVMVSPESFARQLQAAGLPLRESGGYYGYSLALGSAEVSLLALTNAYRTLANGGRYGESRMLPATAATPAPHTLPAIDPRAAFIVGDILSDANARTRTFGVDSVLGTRFWTAVKTGTSKDMRDNWAVGWSQRYTVGVWVGNAGGAPMWDVSGTSGAAPVWAEVMGFLHAREPSRAPATPPGVVQVPVRFGNDLEAPRSEWFLAGTEQKVFAPDAAAADTGNRITSPADGSVIAIDPDIPPNRQRVRFEAQGQGLQWRIDGKVFARGNQAQWMPWPGRHVIELADARGEVLDRVRVEVRGAGVLAPVARHP
ncbi:penicillin-binding protein 1C [Variovorax sp. ZT4R33]|uniref:penicillin-binding protein 1C n=1 Tax=Variovorax sp. ZT4R33 TaxID=3443743 RepID=UPI003F475552